MGKQPRIPENPANVDTVAVVGAVDAGFDERAIEAFFAQLPGFIAFKQNPTMGGGFAKFASAALAAQAVALAKEEAIPADMAKSSMGTVPGKLPPGYPPTAYPPPAQHTTSWTSNQGNTQPVGMGTDYGIWPKGQESSRTLRTWILSLWW